MSEFETHPEGVGDWEDAERREHEFDEYLRETAQEARDRIGDLGDLPEPLRWKIEVCAAGCQIHDNPADCEGEVQAAHVISQQSLRRRGLEAHLWDRRNGIAACRRAHTRSDSGLQRFPAVRIPAEAWKFAAWLNLTYLIERLYGKRPDEEHRERERRCTCGAVAKSIKPFSHSPSCPAAAGLVDHQSGRT